jgi:hypothetical protein
VCQFVINKKLHRPQAVLHRAILCIFIDSIVFALAVVRLPYFFLRRLSWRLLVVVLLAGPALSGCRLFHPYRIPDPKGPPQPHSTKKKSGKDATEAADGSTTDTSSEPAKVQKNSYDKGGLLKKPKLKRRRLKHKVGQRKFLWFKF